MAGNKQARSHLQCQVMAIVASLRYRHHPTGRHTAPRSARRGSRTCCSASSAAVTSLQTANKFCAKQGKFAVIRNTSGPTNPFGYDNDNQLLFSCVDENDPDYQRPTLCKDNGITTLEQR